MRATETSEDELEFDLIDRLHKSLRVSGHSAETLAVVLGVSANTIRNYLSGRTHPSRGMLIAWAFAVDHGVTVDWLEHGGVMPTPPSGRPEVRGPTDPIAELAAKKTGKRRPQPPTRQYDLPMTG